MRKSLISFVLAGLLALLCFGTAQAGTQVLGDGSQSSPSETALDDQFVKEAPDFLGSIRSDEMSFNVYVVLAGHDGGNGIATDAKEVNGFGWGITPTVTHTVLEVNLTQAPHLRL